MEVYVKDEEGNIHVANYHDSGYRITTGVIQNTDEDGE